MVRRRSGRSLRVRYRPVRDVPSRPRPRRSAARSQGGEARSAVVRALHTAPGEGSGSLQRVLVGFLLCSPAGAPERQVRRRDRIAAARRALLAELDPAQIVVARSFEAMPLVILEVSHAMRRALEHSRRVMWVSAAGRQARAREGA